MVNDYVTVRNEKIEVYDDPAWGKNTLNLSYLDISNMREIRGLHQLRHLEKLDLQGNQISKIEGLESLTNLTHLNLSDNQIETVSGLDSLVKLIYLNLDRNYISDLRGLESLLTLWHLSLQENEIRNVRGIEPLFRLEELDLQGNQISKWDKEIADLLPSLKKVNLEGNPIDRKGYHVFDSEFNEIAAQIVRTSEHWSQWGNPKDYYQRCLEEGAKCTVHISRMSPSETRKWIESHPEIPVTPKQRFFSFLHKKPPYQLWIVEVGGTGKDKAIFTISPCTQEVVEMRVIQFKSKPLTLTDGKLQEFLTPYHKVALEVIAEYFFPLRNQTYADFLKQCAKMDNNEARGDYIFRTSSYYEGQTHITQALKIVETTLECLIRENKLHGFIRPIGGKPHFLRSQPTPMPRNRGEHKCPNCGVKIRTEWNTCPQCLIQLAATPSSYCTHCGEPIQSDWKACPYCSNVIHGSSEITY